MRKTIVASVCLIMASSLLAAPLSWEPAKTGEITNSVLQTVATESMYRENASIQIKKVQEAQDGPIKMYKLEVLSNKYNYGMKTDTPNISCDRVLVKVLGMKRTIDKWQEGACNVLANGD